MYNVGTYDQYDHRWEIHFHLKDFVFRYKLFAYLPLYFYVLYIICLVVFSFVSAASRFRLPNAARYLDNFTERKIDSQLSSMYFTFLLLFSSTFVLFFIQMLNIFATTSIISIKTCSECPVLLLATFSNSIKTVLLL